MVHNKIILRPSAIFGSRPNSNYILIQVPLITSVQAETCPVIIYLAAAAADSAGCSRVGNGPPLILKKVVLPNSCLKLIPGSCD